MVIANFNIESEAPVQATYSIDGETDSTITFTRSRQIIINEDIKIKAFINTVNVSDIKDSLNA